MSDLGGQVIADGELTQERAGDRVAVHVQWAFADGRRAEERDEFRVGRTLIQVRCSWVETKSGKELRRFDIDFDAGKGTATTLDDAGRPHREESSLELPPGRSYAGYGTALAVGELSPPPGRDARITFVAFTPKPRAVTLKVSRDGEQSLSVAGRPVPTDRYTLHAELPFPVSLFVHPKDAHLWFTHEAPPTLVRGEQPLAAKDDPVVVIDATPRGPARAGETRALR
jgi:hypothetical protein